MQQIASATLYLQECDLIHSNISSHSVLMNKLSRSVKLTSFELATEIAADTKAAIERMYTRNSRVISSCDGDTVDGIGDEMKTPETKKFEGTLKERYLAASKERTILTNSYSARSFRDMDAKFLPYCVEYRQQLAVYNYQSPELLLVNGERFVFPTEGSDVYSLTLVLWELLNNCVPFAIYEPDELNDLYAANRAHLPILEEERCSNFKQIFKFGFEPDPINRSMTVHHLIKLLDDLKIVRPKHEKSHVMHENSLYGSPATKPITTVHNAAAKKSPMTTSQPNYDIPKRLHTAKPADSAYENTVDAMAYHNKSQKSPLNNVTNSTLQRSVLDFQKLLSPLRVANANIYERARNSTLKKRKKQTPTKQSPSSAREPFENTGVDVNGEVETMNFVDEFSPKLNDNIQPQSDVSLAAVKRKPSIVRNLNYENGEATPTATVRKSTKINKNSKSLIEQPRVAEATQSKVNNSSSQFVIDDYELPKQLIARNNAIRRNTWLSSDTMNTTTNSMAAHVSPSNVIKKTSPVNESGKNNKTLNVTLRIVTKQLTPPGSEKSNSSVASNISVGNDSAIEESPSVLTRIQFFSSLENPSNFTIGGNKSRRSEISFDEAVRQSNRRTQVKTLSAASPPLANNNRQLLKDINDIADEISKCLNNQFDQRKNSSNKTVENNLHVSYVSPVLTLPKEIDIDKSSPQTDKAQPKNISALVKKLFGDDVNPDTDEVDVDASSNEKRNSVKDTVQRIENVLQQQQPPPSHNTSVNAPFRKIENKLLNEKIANTESKSPSKIPPPPKMPSNTIRHSKGIKRTEEMSEKVEEVMQIVGLSECENDAGQPMNAMPTATATARSEFLCDFSFFFYANMAFHFFVSHFSVRQAIIR